MMRLLPLLTLTLGLTFLAACTDSALVDSGEGLDTASKGKQEKVDVCHLSDTGDFILINVNGNALPAHIAHGDGQPGDPVPGVTGKKFDEACGIVDAPPTVTVGFLGQPNQIGVRYRNFSSSGASEIYLGTPNLGEAGNRVEQQFAWQSGLHPIEFEYDVDAMEIRTNVTNPSGSTASATYAISNPITCDLQDLNVMQITVSSRQSGADVNLRGVVLGSFPLGDFDTDGFVDWSVTDFDFASGFKLSGSLELTGTQPSSQELNRVEIKVGCL